MSKVYVQQKEFTDQETGRVVPYERLTIQGYINGEIHTVEVPMGKAELTLAKMLLKSDENEPQANSRKATRAELDAYNEHQANQNADNASWLSE